MNIDGQCSTRTPFNNLIMGSGPVTVLSEVRPLNGDLKLREDAYLKTEVELFDLHSGYEPVSKMALFETPPQTDAGLPFIINEAVFQASVPYSLTGWKKSVRLDSSGDRLRASVVNKYNAIIAMMQNRSFAQYEEAFRERENIMCICFYLSEAEKQERMKEVEAAIVNCTSILPLKGDSFIQFAADGRLVRLAKADGESSLRLFNDITGEETIIEMWLHMRQGSNQLTVI